MLDQGAKPLGRSVLIISKSRLLACPSGSSVDLLMRERFTEPVSGQFRHGWTFAVPALFGQKCPRSFRLLSTKASPLFHLL